MADWAFEVRTTSQAPVETVWPLIGEAARWKDGQLLMPDLPPLSLPLIAGKATGLLQGPRGFLAVMTKLPSLSTKVQVI